MRIFPAFFLATLIASCTTPASAGLVITGLFDGGLPGGEPKVIELVATTNIADLSTYGAGAANNGGGTDGVELILSGSATAGQFIYIVDQNTDPTGFATYFGSSIPASALIFDSNLGSGGGPAAINGDDAVEIFFDGTGAFAGGDTVVDVFGDINVDGTGQAWEYLDGWAYRKNDTGPDGSSFVIGNWDFSGINVTDGVANNASLMPPFPIGSYTFTAVPEPNSLALLGCFAIAAGFRRRRA